MSVEGDILGPTVTRACSIKSISPPLKNGQELRESGYLIAVGSRTARFRRRHKHKIFYTILLISVLFLLSLSIAMTVLYVKHKYHKPIRVCESKECLRSAANLALSMDKTADPCQDFYKFVCGNWASEHPRPDAYRSYDWFRDKQTKVYAMVRDFLGKNTTDQPLPVLQAKDMYAACMDTETLDKLSLNPVFKVLKELGLPTYPTYVNATPDVDYSMYSFDWVETVIKVKTHLGMDVLIGFDIFTDPKNSSVYRLVMGSPETTNPLPSIYNEKRRHKGRRNIRLKSLTIEESLEEIFNKETNCDRNANIDEDDDDENVAHVYKLFYAEIMKLFFIESNIKENVTIDDLDVNILKAANEYYKMNFDKTNDTKTGVEDFYKDIPDYTVNEIQTHTDMVIESNNGTTLPIWKRYLEGIFNISEVALDLDTERIIVSELDLIYMTLMADYVSKVPPVVLELYIWVKVVEVMSIHTTSEIRTIFQHSYDQIHKNYDIDMGIPPRSSLCSEAVNSMLGLAVSYGIADSHFFNVTKPKIQVMLNEMKNALMDLVSKVSWMDSNTKLATYQKIMGMKTLIGFPDWLLENGKLEKYYEGIKINKNTHLENMISIVQVKVKKVLNKLKEGNNGSWASGPTEVNAYHTFQENTITVPLVMLQYPFFDLGLDSLNYGSLGTILGHEITHGFDNFGRQFDKNGNLIPWWTNETINSYLNMTQCFIEQYSNFYITEVDAYVDGKKTLSENIADNGGLREAVAALTYHLKTFGPEEKLPGFEHMSSEQLFFLSYGNLWCGVETVNSLKTDLQDEHSPQTIRAQGALHNSEEFARAWRCPSGSVMNPGKRCVIF